MEQGLTGPRPGQTASSMSKVTPMAGWSVRLRPTWPWRLARPSGNCVLVDINSSLADSMALAAITKVLPVTLWLVLFQS